MNMAQAKQSARRAARARRNAAHRAAPPGTAGRAISANFLAEPRLAALLRPGTVAAGYFPMSDEANCLPLMRDLGQRGLTIALPVVVAANHPLLFRAWDPADPEMLEPGPHGTHQPPASAATCTPTLILVPLLAFDRRGFRLGYGGGYYDRTLNAAAGAATAVGLAYAGQRVDAVPREASDAPLDWVVTDAAAHLCRKA